MTYFLGYQDHFHRSIVDKCLCFAFNTRSIPKKNGGVDRIDLGMHQRVLTVRKRGHNGFVQAHRWPITPMGSIF